MVLICVKEISSHVLGALSVDPALRAMEQLLIKELQQSATTATTITETEPEATQESDETLKEVLENLE